MNRTVLALALGVSLLGAQGASAMKYIFAFTTAADRASGTFTTVAAAPSPVIAVSGTFDGYAITGLSPYGAADNVLYAKSPYVSFAGITFTANDINYNIYSHPVAYLIDSVTNPGGGPTDKNPLTSFSITAVPEPAMWGLMIGGIALTGFAMRRRRVTVAA